MEIICPQCGFGREVAPDKVPAKSVFATCPKCRFKFRFRALEEPEYEFDPGDDEPAAAPAPAPPVPASAPEPPAPARGEAASAAAPPPPPAAPPAPPAPPRPDDRPVRRIVLRDEDAAENAPEADRDPAPSGRPGDIWQKLENLAREESRRSEAEDGPDHPGPGAGAPPWENLAEHGFFRGLRDTIAGAVFHPARFFRSLPAGGGLARPAGFYILLAMFSAAMQTIWLSMFFDTLNQAVQIPEEFAQHLQFNLARDLLGVVVLTPAFAILKLFLGAGVVHLALRTLNSAGGGFSGTFRATAYTNATAIFAVIPLLGILLDLFWWMAVFLVALKETHRSSYGRVLLAIHLPVVVFILAAVVAFNLPGGA